MSILKRYTDAIDNKDEATMNELLHDDFKFTMHKSGNSLGKADVIKFPSYEKALEWYNSDEYKPIKQIRLENSIGNGIIIKGV